MELSQAPGVINVTSAEHARSLSDLIPAELIHQALALTDIVTLRKRKLPLESMIWLVVGMSVFCNRPMAEIVNLMDIAECSGTPFTARSSVIQRRKNSGKPPSGNCSILRNNTGTNMPLTRSGTV